MECRTNATDGNQLIVNNPLGGVTNLDCRTPASYIHIELCEKDGQLYRFSITNPTLTLAIDGFWSCRRISNLNLSPLEGSSDPVLVNISKLPSLLMTIS